MQGAAYSLNSNNLGFFLKLNERRVGGIERSESGQRTKSGQD
jgi:hypothetical protein